MRAIQSMYLSDKELNPGSAGSNSKNPSGEGVVPHKSCYS